MANDTVHIGARLDADLVREVDKSASEDHRDRTGQLRYLTELGLAGRRRLKELERLAYSGTTSQRPEAGATKAGQAHLAEHRRMCGFDPSSSEESPDHG